jgi:hypothetical protein
MLTNSARSESEQAVKNKAKAAVEAVARRGRFMGNIYGGVLIRPQV